MRTLPMPPDMEKKEEELPKRFIVERYGNDQLLEVNLNRLHAEGYELRHISYDPGLKRGPWGVVLENTRIPRR